MGRPQPGTPISPCGACRCGLQVCQRLTVIPSRSSSSITVVLPPPYGGFRATATDLLADRIPRSPDAGSAGVWRRDRFRWTDGVSAAVGRSTRVGSPSGRSVGGADGGAGLVALLPAGATGAAGHGVHI